ncbi:uncharacterized protein VTP21DRAFT_1215 [Calcarisporiella thermophila]|uniref:uncharacterized protein n=1 Tax=Calcarisporiella thermophila TaxID=911321 RepID=UPI00374327D0
MVGKYVSPLLNTIAPGTPFDTTGKLPQLFQSIKIRDLSFKNKIVVSPMCMYSAKDGVPNDFHFMHYAQFAIRGAGLIIVEATAVLPEGRISPEDLGLWNDEQMEAFKRIVDYIHSQGALAGIQIAHAGRKASMHSPQDGYKLAVEERGGWPNQVVGPTSEPFDAKHSATRQLEKHEIARVAEAFGAAARRAAQAGFDVIDIHGAHGYLIHSFLSGNSNSRTDEYGGSLENRMRLAIEVATAVRTAVPDKVVFFRLSAKDWTETQRNGGWDLEHSTELAKRLKEVGVDLIDVSSGGNISQEKKPTAAGYQVPFAEAIRKNAEIKTSAVGGIVDPQLAEDIIAEGKADLIMVGQEFLRNTNWTLRAAFELGADVKWPNQYQLTRPLRQTS